MSQILWITWQELANTCCFAIFVFRTENREDHPASIECTTNCAPLRHGCQDWVGFAATFGANRLGAGALEMGTHQIQDQGQLGPLDPGGPGTTRGRHKSEDCQAGGLVFSHSLTLLHPVKFSFTKCHRPFFCLPELSPITMKCSTLVCNIPIFWCYWLRFYNEAASWM